jgi:hypothetical protein
MLRVCAQFCNVIHCLHMLTHHLSVIFHVTVQLGNNAVLTHADSPPVCHLPWQCPHSSAQSAACGGNIHDGSSGCQSCRAVTLAKDIWLAGNSLLLDSCLVLPDWELSSYNQLLHVSHAGRMIVKQAAPQSSQTRPTPITCWSPGKGSPPAACCQGKRYPDKHPFKLFYLPQAPTTSHKLLTNQMPDRSPAGLQVEALLPQPAAARNPFIPTHSNTL